jgi:hypothetical protein
MAPALTIDNTPDFDMLEVDMSSDFNMPQAGNKPNLDPEVDPSKLTIKHRTLLISPPSVSARPEKIAEVLEAHDRDATDLHMLDRLIANAVDLPDAAYDTVLIISNEQGDPRESAQLFTANADVFVKIMKSMKPGAMMRSQDLTFGFGDEMIEGVMAGMIVEPDGDRGLQKPEWAEDEVVALKTKKPVRYLGQDENGNVINEKQYASRILLDEDGYIDEDSLMRDVPNIKPDYSGEFFRTMTMLDLMLILLTLQRANPESRSVVPARTALAASHSNSNWRRRPGRKVS